MIELVTTKAAKYLIWVATVVAFVNLVADPSALTGAGFIGWLLATLLQYAYDLRTDQLVVCIQALRDNGFDVVYDSNDEEVEL